MIRRFLLAVMLVLTLKGQGCETTTPDFAPQETDVEGQGAPTGDGGGDAGDR